MARANTQTKLPLDRWAEIIGLHPLHFNQVYFGELTLCGHPWFQHEWQAVDRVGREAVARAIAQAEADIERFIGYRLLPTWEVDEWLDTVRAWQKEFVNLTSRDLRGFDQSVFAQWGQFIAGGIERKTLIDDAVAVAYSDEDGDGYLETATVTVAATEPACELAIFYPGQAGDDAWEIRPVEVSIAAGVATILFRREQAVLPELMSGLTPLGVDGAEDANFLTTVDVYRRDNDPSQQATLLWRPLAQGCSCSGAGCMACAYSAQTACLIAPVNPALSVASYVPATWDADEGTYTQQALSVGRQPDIVRLWYYAGYENRRLACPRIEMADWLARAVAYYAASILDRPVCECNNVHAFIQQWREDLSAIKDTIRYQVTDNILDCPFGPKRGALQAWKLVLQEARLSGAPIA